MNAALQSTRSSLVTGLTEWRCDGPEARVSDPAFDAVAQTGLELHGSGRKPSIERVLTLDFLVQRENVIVVAPHGLGKTMIAKNLVYEAILAGHSAPFLTAADLILDLTRQETARAL